MGYKPGQSLIGTNEDHIFRTSVKDGIERDMNVTILSTAVDASNSPTTTLRKGLVVGKNSAGKYLEAVNTNVVGPAAAVLTSTAGTFDFEGVVYDLLLIVDGKTHTIEFSHGAFAASDAATATEIATIISAACAEVACSTSSGKVVITHDYVGSEHYLKIAGGTANTVLGFDAADGSSGVTGTDGSFGILAEAHSTLDETGTAADMPTKIVTAGIIDKSALYGLTIDAERALIKQGCIFR